MGTFRSPVPKCHAAKTTIPGQTGMPRSRLAGILTVISHTTPRLLSRAHPRSNASLGFASTVRGTWRLRRRWVHGSILHAGGSLYAWDHDSGSSILDQLLPEVLKFPGVFQCSLFCALLQRDYELMSC